MTPQRRPPEIEYPISGAVGASRMGFLISAKRAESSGHAPSGKLRTSEDLRISWGATRLSYHRHGRLHREMHSRPDLSRKHAHIAISYELGLVFHLVTVRAPTGRRAWKSRRIDHALIYLYCLYCLNASGNYVLPTRRKEPETAPPALSPNLSDSRYIYGAGDTQDGQPREKPPADPGRSIEIDGIRKPSGVRIRPCRCAKVGRRARSTDEKVARFRRLGRNSIHLRRSHVLPAHRSAADEGAASECSPRRSTSRRIFNRSRVGRHSSSCPSSSQE